MAQTPTVQQLAQWQAWLAEAQAAYQRLMVGQLAVEVAIDGNTFTTRFQRVDADKLETWIVKLQGWIAAASFSSAPCGGAIGIIF